MRKLIISQIILKWDRGS